jgi:adenosylmethionine-8-amino-7-oxononanoate aminotransferase
VRWLDDTADLETLDDPRDVAGLILEPVLAGAAGMRPWGAGTLRRCREWCDAHGALLLHDEVFTGFGRTGTMFAFEHESAPADILVLGKALSGGVGPLSATVVTDRVFRPFAEAATVEENFLYGHSYAGHALACAAGLASLDVFAAERVLERLTLPMAALHAGLARLATVPGVRETRGIGFAGAVEVEDRSPSGSGPSDYGRRTGRAVTRECWDLGLAARAIGNSVVLVLPLCATADLVHEAVAILESAIRRVSADGSGVSAS